MMMSFQPLMRAVQSVNTTPLCLVSAWLLENLLRASPLVLVLLLLSRIGGQWVVEQCGVLVQQVGVLGAAPPPEVLDLHDLGEDALVEFVLAGGGTVVALVHVIGAVIAFVLEGVIGGTLVVSALVPVLLHELQALLRPRLIHLGVVTLPLAALLMGHVLEALPLLRLRSLAPLLLAVASNAGHLPHLPCLVLRLRILLVVGVDVLHAGRGGGSGHVLRALLLQPLDHQLPRLFPSLFKASFLLLGSLLFFCL
mmetsp:Transcript_927/g.2832  ORF Transcript_927/g.2832 Transcript_927/m.2832 type:complete len:253 (-) Transcript_927:339-1097(-)